MAAVEAGVVREMQQSEAEDVLLAPDESSSRPTPVPHGCSRAAVRGLTLYSKRPSDSDAGEGSCLSYSCYPCPRASRLGTIKAPPLWPCTGSPGAQHDDPGSMAK